jgi:asparagine synthase (glutamine-hydrolysing)
MCGIAGRWLRVAQPAPIGFALELLDHRGPDDRGTWQSPGGALELGHTRLSIIDLSAAGHQPMCSADGRVVLVYNGELYNHRELRAGLAARGHPFRGRSDTEVVLAMYLEHGRRALERLNGMFALALFDRDSGELWLARDALGVKPLYFAEGEHGFAFASELKALLRLMPVGAALDVPALYRYLAFLWCPGTATPLAGVSRVAPGEELVVRDGRVVSRRRWSAPEFSGERAQIRRKEAAHQVAGALRAAVERQLVADVPVGALLSGGLDSSAIVAFARETLPQLDCFTCVPQGGPDVGEGSDLPYARLVARHLGVRLHEVPIRSDQLATELERMVYRLDEPIADPAPLALWLMSERARQHGVKVLLSGVGGDDLFSGYRRHQALVAERAWQWLPAPWRRGLRLGTAAAARIPARHPAFAPLGRAGAGGAWLRRAAKAFSHADQSADDRLLGYFSWADPALLRGLFAREHRECLTAEALHGPMREFLAQLPPGLVPLERLLALDQRFFLGDHNLPYADKMSMAASVELRVPFLDPDVVALANRLPASVKQHGRHGKWILKRAMEPILPREVIERPKTGFGAPLRRWVRGELAELIGDVLSPLRVRDRGLFDAPHVQALIEQNRRGELDAAHPILALCCVELWCRQFLDGRSDRPRAGEAAA